MVPRVPGDLTPKPVEEEEPDEWQEPSEEPPSPSDPGLALEDFLRVDPFEEYDELAVPQSE